MFNINMNSRGTMDTNSLFSQLGNSMNGGMQGGTQGDYGPGYVEPPRDGGFMDFSNMGKENYRVPAQDNFNSVQQSNQGIYAQGYNKQGGYDQGYNQQGGYDQQMPQQGGYAQQGGYDQSYNQQMPQQSGYNQQMPQQAMQGGYNQQGYSQQPMQGGYNQQMSQQPMQRPAATGVILSKGQKYSLTSNNPGLDYIDVGLGWDLAPGVVYDLDVEAFLLNGSGRVIGDDWFVFYNQASSPDGSVVLAKSSNDGQGYGDDEVITTQLSRVNPQVERIVFVVTINDAKIYGYNFGQVRNAYVRIVNKANGMEIARFNLTDMSSNVCSMMVGELYRHNGEWKFNSIGMGTNDDLEGLCIRYGVNVQG